MAWISSPFRYLKRIAAAAALVTAVLGAAAEGSHIQLKDGAFHFGEWAGGQNPPVFAGSSDTPMLGTYTVEAGDLVFAPRFPAVPGTRYHGVYRGEAFELTAAGKPATPARIEHIYPSGSVLPANTLRIYICFSAPMRRGDALQHVHLLDARGDPLPDVFLDQELWDAEYRRLTLLFDPGRIKRGLVPAKEAGSPLVEGRHYTLTVDAQWRDGNGLALEEPARKAFAAGPADRLAPDPAAWRLVLPKAGTTDPLIVQFPKPMDYALLERMLTVRLVAGRATLGRQETEWRFAPELPWKAGAAELVADPALEDIAGNQLFRPFETERRRTPVTRDHNGPVTIPFILTPQ